MERSPEMPLASFTMPASRLLLFSGEGEPPHCWLRVAWRCVADKSGGGFFQFMGSTLDTRGSTGVVNCTVIASRVSAVGNVASECCPPLPPPTRPPTLSLLPHLTEYRDVLLSAIRLVGFPWDLNVEAC